MQTPSWLNLPAETDFSVANLPYGIFKSTGHSPRAGMALGEHIIDLSALYSSGFLTVDGLKPETLSQPTLNAFIAQGKEVTVAFRDKVQELFTDENNPIKNSLDTILVKQSDAEMLLPLHIGNYTDFYSSEDHARNVGKMFRDPENALLPNWKHLPVGYHGRASSIVPSGVDLHRPWGQLMPPEAEAPVFSPSQRVDFELEMAFVVGKPNKLGQPITTANAKEHIFGLMLLNDWSARDIQKWEYVPLGPFLAKSFGSTVSPWIVPLEALEPFKTNGPKQNPEVLLYLKQKESCHYDIPLQAWLTPENGEPVCISKTNFTYMYWSMAQQLAHHSVNGCNMQVGDVLASGTISGPEKEEFGSMLELAWAGKEPLQLADGSERKFLKDGDTLTLKGAAGEAGQRVGFGEASAKLLPAIDHPGK
jgi:fumarylacetoacetase